MKVRAIDGQEFEISMDEAKRIAEHLGMHPVINRNPEFTGRMRTFFTHYKETAAKHIQEVVESMQPPMCEKEVKAAIARAISRGTPEEAAEVLFEAMEWETAYANLKSIE